MIVKRFESQIQVGCTVADVQQDDDVFIMKLRMNNATSNRVSEHLKCQQ
jgi:hypothetical protein